MIIREFNEKSEKDFLFKRSDFFPASLFKVVKADGKLCWKYANPRVQSVLYRSYVYEIFTYNRKKGLRGCL